MSWNRENVVWQSKDGHWNIGFFKSYSSPNRWDDEDFDPEWDVEYDYEEFFFASVGHPSELSAQRAWKGANPGGCTVIAYTKENAEECAQYDRMARNHLHPEIAAAEAKKEIAKLNRTHMKKLKEQFNANNDFKSVRVTVVFKLDEKAYDNYGGSRSYTGLLRQEGDWLTIDREKVKNTKTGNLNRHLHSIKPVTRDYWGRYNY